MMFFIQSKVPALGWGNKVTICSISQEGFLEKHKCMFKCPKIKGTAWTLFIL